MPDSTISRLGGLRKSMLYDSVEATAPARAAFLDRFEREVDPDGVLNPQERRRRADAAKRLHFTKLALKSVKARRGRNAKAARS